MDRKLNDAAKEGSVSSLRNLLQEDALLLDRFIAGPNSVTPLHVASARGRVEFVDLLLTHKPGLTEQLDSQDSSPLHLATAQGRLDIVKKLLQVNPDMCLVSDIFGRNPLHIAAIRGHLDVLKELVDARPSATRSPMKEGETILHACVRYNQLEAMKFLVEKVADHELMNRKNHDGNTILHLAVSAKRTKTVNFLISSNAVDLNSQNEKGFTPLDLLSQRVEKSKNELVNIDQDADWVEKKHNALMLVASLLATMAFQAGISPPKGILDKYSHILYALYIVSNTVGFLASLSIVLLLISGLPIKKKSLTWILIVITWVAVSAMALTYLISLEVLTFGDNSKGTQLLGLFLWIGLISLLLIGHTIRLRFRLKNQKSHRVEGLNV